MYFQICASLLISSIVVIDTNVQPLLFISDTGLSPYSDYEYSVSVVNSAGSSSSSYVRVQTLQAAPGEVKAPVTRVNPDQLYIIYLTWDTPGKPNGKCT